MQIQVHNGQLQPTALRPGPYRTCSCLICKAFHCCDGENDTGRGAAAKGVQVLFDAEAPMMKPCHTNISNNQIILFPSELLHFRVKKTDWNSWISIILMGSGVHHSMLTVVDTRGPWHPWKVTIFSRGPQAFQALQCLWCTKLWHLKKIKHGDGRERGNIWFIYVYIGLWHEIIAATPFLIAPNWSQFWLADPSSPIWPLVWVANLVWQVGQLDSTLNVRWQIGLVYHTFKDKTMSPHVCTLLLLQPVLDFMMCCPVLGKFNCWK